MKKTLSLLLLGMILASSIAGCDQPDNTATTTTEGQALSTTAPTTTVPTPPTTTTAPATTTSPVTTAPITTEPPATTEPPVTEPPVTEPETTPEPLPGNPEKYGFTMVPFAAPDTWFGFDEASHWSFWYTTQTSIKDSLKLSSLKPCTYDEATQNWVPSADAYEKGWRAENNGSATLIPITGMSAVMAFTAPEDGTYEFEFYLKAGNRPGTDSDGVKFFLFGDDRMYLSEYFYNGESDELTDPDELKRISLKKGESAYFVVDPLKNGKGDVCESFTMIRVQRQMNRYVDNQTVYAFGHSYDAITREQGSYGWYAGYLEPDAALTPQSFGSNPMPAEMVAGAVFDWGSCGESDQRGTVLWEATEDGTYTVSVNGWWHDCGVLISFYHNGELITAVSDDFFSGNYQMTCDLKAGECFAITFTHSENPQQDNILKLTLLIEKAS